MLKVVHQQQAGPGAAGVCISAAIQSVAAEIECPRCRGRYMLVEGDRATCRQCSQSWDYRRPPLAFRGDRNR